MRKFLVAGAIAFGLLLSPAGAHAQVITIGGSVLGRPLGITGKTVVRFSELPPNAQQMIQAQAGGGVIAYVQQGLYTGPGYGVSFMKNGGVQTLQFTENGLQLSGYGGLVVSPVSNLESIQLQQLPPAVQNSAKAIAGDGYITFAVRGVYSAPVFDALVQPPGASSQHVVVTPSGGLLQGVTANETAAVAPQAVVTEPAGANAPSAPLNSDAARAAATPVGQVTGTLSFQDLSWTAQQPMLNRSSYAHIDTVQMLALPGGGIGYRGIYTRNGQQYQVTVAQDGTVISEGLLNPGGAR